MEGTDIAPDFSCLSAIRITDVTVALSRLAGAIHRTPVLTSRTADRQTGASVFFKAEPFQRTGSFKFRGAYNALAQLSEEQRQRGVLAYSSGNHAQAIALAGQLLGVPVTVAMPENAPAVKRTATEDYGAEIVAYDPQTTQRETLAADLARDRGLTLVPPYDCPEVIAGQGTVAWELFDEVGPLDWLLVCCGGGGLLSGCALAAAARSPGCRVVGVEPALAADAARSFRTGRLHRVANPPTVADGARTPSLGRYTFPLVCRHASAMMTVSEEEIVQAMRWLWERLKLVVEPTGALAAAALLAANRPERWAFAEGRSPEAGDDAGIPDDRAWQAQAREDERPFAGDRVGVVLSGGNADLARISNWFA